MIKHIKEEEFQKEVLEKEGLVLVDFFATWCPPCEKLGEELKKIEAKNKEISIIKIDVDESINLAIKYKVEVVPTLIVFYDGKEEDVTNGYMPEEKILKIIKKVDK